METVNEATPTAPWAGTPAAAPLPQIPGYEVLALVGRGGMGKVYRARQTALGRVVALKVLAHEADDKLLARFAEEARAVAKLQHPNVAQMFETGLADGRPFYTQEFLDGGSLAESFAGRPQNPEAAAKLVETISRALQHSHDHGILHRDLKPANVLLAADGTPKVTDFGLAKVLAPADGTGDTASGGANLTRTGEIVGTPSYMPPEQASGVVSALGPATDVYGLGAILYEALTGRPPFQAPDPFQTVMMVLSMEPMSPRALQPTVPRDLETICLKCLEKSPRKRYRSAGELADDLRRFLNREPILARPVGFFERAAKWARRKPWQAVAAGLVAVLVVGLAGGLAWAVGKNREVREANDKLGGANADLARTNTDLERANKDITAAKDEAEQALSLALGSLDRYYFEFSDSLKDIPKAQKLRIEVLDQARKTIDKLGQLRPGDVTIRNYQMTAYDRLGNAESVVGRLAKAEEAYARARDVSRGLAAQFPGETMYVRNSALGSLKLAGVAQQLGHAGDANRHFAEAEEAAAPLARAGADDPQALDCLARLQLTRYGRALVGKDKDAAEPELRKLLDLHRRLAALEPDNPLREVERIETEMMLAGLLVTNRKLGEAEKLAIAGLEALGKLPDQTAPRVRKLRASVRGTLGMLRDNQMRTAEAEAEYEAVLAEYRALSAEFPDNPQYRYQVGTNLWWLAQFAKFTDRGWRALLYFAEARRVLAALVRDFPDDAQFKRSLAMTEEDLAQLVAKPPEKKP